MKISEAIMYAVHKAGGQVEYTKFAEWIGYLIKNDYLEMICDGEGQNVNNPHLDL